MIVFPSYKAADGFFQNTAEGTGRNMAREPAATLRIFSEHSRTYSSGQEQLPQRNPESDRKKEGGQEHRKENQQPDKMYKLPVARPPPVPGADPPPPAVGASLFLIAPITAGHQIIQVIDPVLISSVYQALGLLRCFGRIHRNDMIYRHFVRTDFFSAVDAAVFSVFGRIRLHKAVPVGSGSSIAFPVHTYPVSVFFRLPQPFCGLSFSVLRLIGTGGSFGEIPEPPPAEFPSGRNMKFYNIYFPVIHNFFFILPASAGDSPFLSASASSSA